MLRAPAMALALLCAAATTAQASSRVLVLSPQDEARYAEAYRAADAKDWAGMDRAVSRIEDGVLTGDLQGRKLLAQRRPTQRALLRWLEANADHPLSGRVRDQAGRSASQVPAPAPRVRRAYVNAATVPPGDTAAARAAVDRIVESVTAGDFAGAEAYAEASAAGPRAGEAAWWGGLLAFRRGDYAVAAARFEAAAAWPHWDGWRAAGAHYWAARSRIASGQGARALTHLAAAAARPATFYGQLAEAELGRETPLDMSLPPLDEASVRDFVLRHPGARRAAALAQLGRHGDVESELHHLWAHLPRGDERLFLAFAEALAAPSAQLRAAEFGGLETGAGFCPTAPFAPDDGYRLDRAIVLAVTRQESRFDPEAVSRSNAQGLMQLLPSTADHVAGGRVYRRNPALLHEPGLNMRLGQAYLEQLKAMTDYDVAKTFAAYNGGPGFLSRWLERFGDASDTLLVMEMLPRGETRDFTERVQSHLALCRKRHGQRPLELEAIASGQAPVYRPQDERTFASAPQPAS